MLDARTRSAGGNALNSMAMPTGIIIPPPTPWRTRNRTSWERLSARPHRTEAPVKMPTARSRIRLDPKRSPNHPAAGMNTARLTRYPTATESRAAVDSWNWWPMAGRATLTMVTSMMLMNMAAT